MDEELQELPRIIDPLGILPFECELESDEPNIQRMPKQYQGSDAQLYAHREGDI